MVGRTERLASCEVSASANQERNDDGRQPLRSSPEHRVHSCDARRQLHVSAAIVAIMAVAAVAPLAMPRPPHGAYNPAPIKLTVHAPLHAHFERAARAAG